MTAPEPPNEAGRLFALDPQPMTAKRSIKFINVADPPAGHRSEGERGAQPQALLLDLSGDKGAAMDWAKSRLGDFDIRPIQKADLKWQSKREVLAQVRALTPDTFAIFTSDIETQSALGAITLFAVLAGARRVVIGDRAGRAMSVSRLRALLIEGPRYVLELVLGYGLVVPLSWLLTILMRASLIFRDVARASETGGRLDRQGSLTALHVRATLTNVTVGGMVTHIAGLARGAGQLGHRLKFIASGPLQDKTLSLSQELTADDYVSIKPSTSLSATRALFELWNNLVFTAKSLGLVTGKSSWLGKVDFIYQRYSRFNWTGVILSLVTGLPLVLEFNGSEVRVSRAWDPVGQLWLLKLFEQLNLTGADLISVVSEACRRDLILAGVGAEKIIVNPNGVDADEFRPGSGGREVRRRMGVEGRIVVGFLGTFGPWHGAPVLAEAASQVSEAARYHFLFIGDGDQRAMTESIIEAAGQTVSATFTGSIPHEDVPAQLDACDILVSPHVEPTDGDFFGSPTKLFEYMATGRPVIASRLGQIADVIIDGENGLLVEPGASVALARAIERLAADEAMRARLGAAARETVIERYTWRQNAARVFEAVTGRS